MKPRVFHPEASREYTEAAEYYARVQGELGGRFYDEVERLILDIRRQPDRFRQFDAPPAATSRSMFPRQHRRRVVALH